MAKEINLVNNNTLIEWVNGSNKEYITISHITSFYKVNSFYIRIHSGSDHKSLRLDTEADRDTAFDALKALFN